MPEDLCAATTLAQRISLHPRVVTMYRVMPASLFYWTGPLTRNKHLLRKNNKRRSSCRQAGRERCCGRVIIAAKGNGRKEHETFFSEIYFALWMEYLMTYPSARDWCTDLQRCTLSSQQLCLLFQRHDILEAINNVKTEELFFSESISLCQVSRLRPLVLLIKVV